MAAAVELLHVATLIHDDTVDNSDLRRGKATVSNLWGQHAAVLFGDYVFATSATFVCDTGNVRVIRRFSETIMDLASGELIEYFSAFDTEEARRLYDERIYRKTASLFCTSAETGAILGGAPEPQVQALRSYGYNIGMAFQIMDDLLDVQGDSAVMGKPVGNDLLQGVLTLPTIKLMERYPADNPVKSLFEDRNQDGRLQQALEMINNSPIIDECYTVVRGYCDAASTALETLPDTLARRSLLDISRYTRERRH
jgi:octaprenyl-diphosphate synthase